MRGSKYTRTEVLTCTRGKDARGRLVNQDNYGFGKSKDAVQEYRISRIVCDVLGGMDSKVGDSVQVL